MSAKIKTKKEVSSGFDAVVSTTTKPNRLWRALDQDDASKKKTNKQKPSQNEENHRTRRRTQPRTSDKIIGQDVGHNLGQSWDKPRTSSTKKEGEKQNHRTQPRTIIGQSWDKPRTQPRTQPRTDFSFLSMTGLQKKILLYIFDICRISHSRTTPEIASTHIVEFTESTLLSVRKTIQRLEKKELLIRKKFKDGPSGWTQYELPEPIFNEIKMLEIEVNHRTQPRTIIGQSWDKPRTQPRTQPRTNAPSSSSYISNNKTTTTEEGELFNLSDQNLIKLSPEWIAVDISPLDLFGFTKHHLHQIIQQQKLTPEVVQESIYAFAFDVRVNKKDKNIKSFLNYFMGILRKGIPYAPPENYKTPDDEAMEKYLEWQKKSKEKTASLKQKVEDLEFSKWSESLSPEEKQKFAPKIEEGSFLQKGHLRNHFNKEVWPNIKEEVFASISPQSEKMTKSQPTP